MEILSYGDELKIESPKSLIKELVSLCSNALEIYKT